MDLVVSIENATQYTPYLSGVTLQGATWVYTQELTVDQPIAASKRVVGMLDASIPFSGVIVVHYGFVAPGPGGADVTIRFSGDELDGQLLLGYGTDGGALANTTADLIMDQGTRYLMVRIAG